jgi:hypothetical protein
VKHSEPPTEGEIILYQTADSRLKCKIVVCGFKAEMLKCKIGLKCKIAFNSEFAK